MKVINQKASKLFVLLCLLLTEIFLPIHYTKANSESLMPPTAFKVNDIGTGVELKLTWENNDPDVVGYIIYRSNNDINFDKLIENPITGNSYLDNTVLEGNKYYYRIASVSQDENISVPSASIEGIATKHPPSMPNGLAVKWLDENEKLIFTWEKNSEPDVIGYNIYQSFDQVNYQKINNELIAELSYTTEFVDADDNNSQKTPYYRISAVNEREQESILSIAVSIFAESNVNFTSDNMMKNNQFLKDLRYWGHSSYQTINNDWHEAAVTLAAEGYGGTIKNGSKDYESVGGSLKVALTGANRKSKTGVYQRSFNVVPTGEPVGLSFAWRKNHNEIEAKRQDIWVDIVKPDSTWERVWLNTSIENMAEFAKVENLDVTEHFKQNGTYEVRFMTLMETNNETNAVNEIYFDEVYLSVPRAPDVPLGLTVKPLPEGEVLQLSWLTSSKNVVGYNIYRSDDGEYGTYKKINQELVTAIEYPDKDLKNNQLYFYRITAVGDNDVESVPSRHIRGVPNFIDKINHPHHSYSDNTNACASCHITHKGNQKLLNNTKEAQVCFTCHNGTGSRYNTALNFNQANKAFHPVNGTEVSPDGSMECSSCHNPHAGNGKRTTPKKAVGSLEKVAGVDVSYGTERFSQPVTVTMRSSIEFEYQLCFTCHINSDNYERPPVGTKSIETAKEFHPENLSGHHNVAEYQTSGFGSYSNGWTPDSPMFCTDCHGGQGENNHEGVHGSPNENLLKQPFTDNTKGTDPNNLCLTCHDANSYGAGGDQQGRTRFFGGTKNLHNIGDHRVACAQCHSAVPHGNGRLPALLVTMEDAPPYRKYNTDTNVKIWYTPDGDWSDKNTCGTNGNCHK